LFVFVATAFAVALLLPHSRSLMDLVYETFVASPPDKSVGVLVSIITSIAVFAYVAITQNIRFGREISRYRWAELKLVELGKMKIDEVMTYHARYNWFSYAGMSFSTLLIITSLLYTGSPTDKDQTVIVFMALSLLGIASIILAVIDIFHTNSLSPLITIRKRFELINRVIILGGAAIVLQVCAISIFLSLINPWLSIFASVTAIYLIISFSLVRGVPPKALQAERQLTDDELHQVKKA
jgi:hypothetical protein